MGCFNSRGNYTKVNRFAGIYTLTEGRRTWPRRDREGRAQLEWAAQDLHVLTVGSAGLITDRDLCYTARAEGSGPCVLRGVCWTFPLFPSFFWVQLDLGYGCPQFTAETWHTIPVALEISKISALYYWKMCSTVFPRGSSLQTPSPLPVSSLLLESGKDSQDLDLNRQVVAKRETWISVATKECRNQGLVLREEPTCWVAEEHSGSSGHGMEHNKAKAWEEPDLQGGLTFKCSLSTASL